MGKSQVTVESGDADSSFALGSACSKIWSKKLHKITDSQKKLKVYENLKSALSTPQDQDS